MSLGGGIVRVGGGSGSGGTTSGIQSINLQTGPSVAITGVNGISVTAGGNLITIDGSGISGGSASGLCYHQDFVNLSSVTGVHNFGTLEVIAQVYDPYGFMLMPNFIRVIDVNTVVVDFNSTRSGKLVILGCGTFVAPSGVNKFSQSFTNISSINVTHNFGTEDVIVQVRDNSSPRKVLVPDDIIMLDPNTVQIIFNTLQSGRLTIMG